MLKEAAKAPPTELACFRRILDNLEPSLELAKERANAWARGDTARKMLDSFVWHEEQGVVQAQRDWVAAAPVALEKNPSTFAARHVEALRELGYTVEEPL